MKYTVRYNNWEAGKGYNYTDVIDTFDSSDCLVCPLNEIAKEYANYCVNDGDEVKVYDENDNLVSEYEHNI